MTQASSVESGDHGRGGQARDDVDERRLLTPGEVAALLHVDSNTVARWCDTGKLRAIRTLGGHRRYFAGEVLRIARGDAR